MKAEKFTKEINREESKYFADKSYLVEQQFKKKNLIFLKATNKGVYEKI